MIEEEDGITLIDFKTDTIEGKFGRIRTSETNFRNSLQSAAFVICKGT